MADSDEANSKKLFRQAWEYSQKIERSSKSCQHSQELFDRNLLFLRNKLSQKCTEVILSGSTHVKKAEELLWKRAVYDVVQRCKQSRQLHQGSPLYSSYQGHLTSAVDSYQMIIADLESKFCQSPSSVARQQDGGTLRGEDQWLVEAYYTMLLRLGDLCRYQHDLGQRDANANAKSFYEQAISLDPTQGRAFNQLAALAGDANESLDALYFYQRSLASHNPYQLSLTNLQNIYDKNRDKVDSIQSKSHHLLEPSIREESRRLVLVQFIQLQKSFSPDVKSGKLGPSESALVHLSDQVVSRLAACLDYDFILYQESCSDKVQGGLGLEEGRSRHPGINNLACFSDDVLLKLTAMSILPSYSLRSLGSTHTTLASQFALSVFAQLLSLSFKRVTSLLYCYLKDKPCSLESIEKMVDSEASLTEVLMEVEEASHTATATAMVTASHTPAVTSSKPVDVERREAGSTVRSERLVDTTMTESSPIRKKRAGKKMRSKVIDRRRRGGQRLDSSDSSDEDEGESSDSSLSLPSNEDSDVQVLESLSETSDSDGEHSMATTVPLPRQQDQANTTGSTVQSRGRRQIVLAASFNLAPSTGQSAGTSKTAESAGQPLGDIGDGDELLSAVYSEAVHQSTVHTSLAILSEDSYLSHIKLFTEWLHSYSIVIATCRMIPVMLWSNFASLLNLLPTKDQLLKSKFPMEREGVDIGLALLPEDEAVKGFPPLMEAFNKRSRLNLTRVEQTASRVLSLLSFGHFLSDLRMAPKFTWDSATHKFIGPAQKDKRERMAAESAKMDEDKLAKLTRSKLMKTMAAQRLKSEVASLTKAKAAAPTVFTPYVIPDAHCLCSGLHLIKKMLKSEKFLFIVPMAVIETLDQMKKGRENYSAREAIKFLESELQSGNKFVRAQKANETLMEGQRRKPPKMDIKAWRYKRLVDCGVYFSQHCGSAEHDGTVTLLLDKSIASALLDASNRDQLEKEIVQIIEVGEQYGIEVDSVLPFYSKWQKQSKK